MCTIVRSKNSMPHIKQDVTKVQIINERLQNFDHKN